jgi:hypothetical protein
MGTPIYVETTIRAPLEEVWRLTQSPDLHQRWDLRLTRIGYLPRPDPGQPQRFRYETRIGFGLAVVGEGESVGERDGADGTRASALRFWSGDPRSSGEQRFYEGPIAFRFPLVLSGVADVHEWFDDATQRFGIDVRVTNRTWGPLFGYRGWFTAEWPPCSRETIPRHVRPVREERRE